MESTDCLTSFAIFSKPYTPKVWWRLFDLLQKLIVSELAIGENLLNDVKKFKWDWVYKMANDLKMSNMKANVLWVGMRGVVTPGMLFDKS